MKYFSYIITAIFAMLLSCDKQPPVSPWMVNQVITGEVNGKFFKSALTVSRGASVVTDMCDKDVIAMSLVRKVQEDEYAIVMFNFFHAKAGDYVLTDSANSHRDRVVCTLDSVTASMSFKSFPQDDISMNTYRLLEGPWNYLKVSYYDPGKNEMQGEFGAKFVRINEHQHAREAVDTIAYTNGKFILANIHVAEVITEPR